MAPARPGGCWLRACGVGGGTRLTRVAHRAPGRLLPLATPPAIAARAAIVAVGSYGGGLVAGDKLHMQVELGPGATVNLTSQASASTKLYRASSPATPPTSLSLDARVGAHALLVVSPDPLVPYGLSAFEGRSSYELHSSASLAAVDWFGVGRTGCGERLEFTSFASRVELAFCEGKEEGARMEEVKGSEGGGREGVGGDEGWGVGGNEISQGGGKESERGLPSNEGEGKMGGSRLIGIERAAVVEAVRLRGRSRGVEAAFRLGDASFDSCASLLLAGERTAQVASRLRTAAASLATPHEGVSPVQESAGEEKLPLQLLGRVVVGVSEAADGVTTARVLAQHHEDVYRVLHWCLAPLASQLGSSPYADRIHASRSIAPPLFDEAARAASRAKIPHDLQTASKWRPREIAPSVSGAEAEEEGVALGVWKTASSSQLLPLLQMLVGFATASSQSAAQLLAPFALSAHAILAVEESPGEVDYSELRRLNRLLDAHLAPTAPARLIDRELPKKTPPTVIRRIEQEFERSALMGSIMGRFN
ncbi:MAG: hypothetical protein SGPRY_003518 [Prymnesium sp.]